MRQQSYHNFQIMQLTLMKIIKSKKLFFSEYAAPPNSFSLLKLITFKQAFTLYS